MQVLLWHMPEENKTVSQHKKRMFILQSNLLNNKSHRT